MAGWQLFAGVAVWWCGRAVVVWHFGGGVAVLRWCGSVAVVWQFGGGVAVWRWCGSVAAVW